MGLLDWLRGRSEAQAADLADKPGREVFADYIREQVEAQEARKASLEQRGLSVITTSGLLVTLLFGLTALVADPKNPDIPDPAQWFLVAALILFTLAAGTAIAVNFPFSFEAVTADELQDAIRNRWDDSRRRALRKTSLTNVRTLRTAKEKNGLKATLLTIAMSLELVAIASVAAAIGFVLWD